MSRSITIPDYKNPFVVVINNSVYQYKGGDTVEVPDEVAEAIEDALEEIPKAKIYLSKFAQRVEGSITELTLSDLEGVEAITSCAFRDCLKLTKIAIPKSVKSIGNWAFSYCMMLPSINIPDGVSYIAEGAFHGCKVLKSVYLPETPPTLATGNVFQDINTACVFYCKTQESLNAYKAAPIWSTLAGTYAFVVEE